MKNSNKPAIILNHTSRLCAHTATDDYSKYASMTELKDKQKTHDPVTLQHNLLLEHQIISAAKLSQLANQAKEQVKQAVHNFKEQRKIPTSKSPAYEHSY